MPGKTKPQPKPLGRPTVIGPDTQQRIIEHLADGGTITSYCKKHKHIARQTVFNYMLTDAGEIFKENVSRARKNGMHAIAEECLEIIDDDDIDTMRARNRGEMRLKLMAAWNREAFGAKQDIDVTNRLSLGDLVEAAIKHAASAAQLIDITPPAQLASPQETVAAPIAQVIDQPAPMDRAPAAAPSRRSRRTAG